VEDHLVVAQNRFAFKLFGTLARQDSGRNVFISPSSVALALAMTYNGARGETRSAMARSLELGELSLGDLNRASAELFASLNSLDPQVRLAIANSLWARQGVEFEGDFVRAARDSYDASVLSLDFARDPVVATVNQWVREHTAGKIESILDRVDPSAILILVNAIYFKGSWSRQFDRRLTREGPFTLPDGRVVRPPMMSQSGKYRYYEDRGFRAVRLPYGRGRMSMYIFLPATRTGLDTFLQSLDATRWDAWLRGFRETDGHIALPRFTLSYAASLNEPLKALGMADAFSSRADFSGMCSGYARIDEVRHKAFVEVNEEGTEAAAATAVTMMRASFAPSRTFSMVVDRPFFCAIRDDQTGAVLFMGAIVAPE
jgi:serine protease inhibitor